MVNEKKVCWVFVIFMTARLLRQLSPITTRTQRLVPLNYITTNSINIELNASPKRVNIDIEFEDVNVKSNETGTWVKLRDYECNIADDSFFLYNLPEFYNDETTFNGPITSQSISSVIDEYILPKSIEDYKNENGDLDRVVFTPSECMDEDPFTWIYAIIKDATNGSIIRISSYTYNDFVVCPMLCDEKNFLKFRCIVLLFINYHKDGGIIKTSNAKRC